jgi:glycosyltransferase involved in cell wall biosynthesis
MKSEAFISVVLVVQNQTEQLMNYLVKLSPYLEQQYSDYEIVIIDQNSNGDIEIKLLDSLSIHQSIRHIRLSQEVSTDIALAAGIENAIGDFVVNLNIESDDVELVHHLVEKGLVGNDIVICVSKKVTSFLYKKVRAVSTWLLQSVGYSLPNNSTGTFCFSRRAINAITESGRFYCKLHMRMANIGYSLYTFDADNYITNPKTKNITGGVIETMHHMIFNSTKPLRWMSFLGFTGSLMAMLFSFYSLIANVINDQVVQGWTTTILFMSLLFAILFIMLSFFGEYLARLLNDRSEHKEYNVIYERNSSVMLNENRSNVIFTSMNEKSIDSQTGQINE